MNLRNALDTFFAQSTVKKAEFLFYPFFMLWRMPIAWGRSLWMARVLLDGKWSSYMGFNPQTAINYLFYRTQWLNINEFGRKGTSPLLGLGNYKLSGFFHLTNFGSYIFAYAGAPVMLAGSIVWSLSHLLWIDRGDVIWSLVVTLSLFFSTTSYAMAFRLQNYQILGWMWFPAALYFMSNGFVVATSIAFLCSAVGGLTQVLFATIVVMAYCYETEAWHLIYSILPLFLVAGIKLLLSMQAPKGGRGIVNVLKTIGVIRQDVKYKREWKIGFETIYFIAHYSLSITLLWLAIDAPPLMPILVLIMFIINQSLLRVADDRSYFILFATVTTFTVLEFEMSLYAWMATWFALNPLGIFFGIQTISKKDGLSEIKCFPPFDLTAIESRIRKFIDKVPSGNSIFFSFERPTNYENIFDGYRFIHELFLYVCNSKQIHVFPDWYAINQTNSKLNDQPIWGRAREEVIRTLNYWNAGYAVVYLENNSTLGNEWLADFEILSTLDWQEKVFDFAGEQMWGVKPSPMWFLIKKR